MEEVTQENKPRLIMDLLEDVKRMVDVEDDERGKLKNDLKKSMRANPFHQILANCLVEQKEKTCLARSMMREVKHENSDERLDTMLKNEGITGPDISISLSHEVVGNEQEEYRQKLGAVRKTYEERMKEYTMTSNNFSNEIRSVLNLQAEFRPITATEVDKAMEIICEKIKKIPQLLKQSACEATIALRKRFFDARRKRRNFSKSSTELLNDYFLKNIEHPYPSEEVKQRLAAQCNISVAQVSNWFGNKRIRYKKTMAKEKEDRHKMNENSAVASLAVNPYAMIPNALAGVMNPYQMMIPGQNMALGVPPFNFPMYNPEMMAQYQQSMQNVNQST